MSRVLVINTGGTFSSADTGDGLSPSLDRTQISAMLQGISMGHELHIEDIYSVDSANILPEDWAVLARRIASEADNYNGVIVIHGTDTMAYTASMLSYMLMNIRIPVVLTGSQLSIAHPSTDALENFRTAMEMACSGHGGIFLAFNRKIFLGNRVSKVKTLSFDAFDSVNCPAIGEVNAKGLHLRIEMLPGVDDEPFALKDAYDERVFVLKLFPGISPDIIGILQREGYKGIYIEGFGLGGVPFLKKNFVAAIDKATNEGMIILVGSQCRYEGSDLGVYETGIMALRHGAVQTYDMTEEAAITKLMWLLGQIEDIDNVASAFGTSLAGEVTLPMIR